MQVMNAYDGMELNLHSFLDSALDDVSGYASVALLSEKELLIPIDQKSGLTSDLIFTLWEKDKCVFLARNRTIVPYSSSPWLMCFPCQESNCSSLLVQPMAFVFSLPGIET
jgi:hypothetical protein